MNLYCANATGMSCRSSDVAISVCFVLICFYSFCGTVCAQDELPEDDLSAVRSDFRASATKIRSLSVEYEIRGYDKRRYRAGAFSRKVIKAMAPCYLYVELAHGHEDMPSTADPSRYAIYVTQSEKYAVRPVSRMYFREAIAADEGLTETLSGESVFMATGIWPIQGRKAPRHLGDPVMLAELANEEKLEVISRNRHVVNGCSCIALKIRATQKLWVDPERGHCIIRREFLEPETGAMSIRYECADHREVAAGVWLPLRIDVTYLGRQDDGRLRIGVLEANKLDKELFHYEPMPGEVESRLVNGEWMHKQIRPGGLDHLDRMVEWVSQQRGLSTRPLPYSVGLTSAVAVPLMVASILLLVSEVMYGVIIGRPNRSAEAKMLQQSTSTESRNSTVS